MEALRTSAEQSKEKGPPGCCRGGHRKWAGLGSAGGRAREQPAKKEGGGEGGGEEGLHAIMKTRRPLPEVRLPLWLDVSFHPDQKNHRRFAL